MRSLSVLIAAQKGDRVVEALLTEYHRNGTTNRDLVSELLLADHQIQMSYVLGPRLSTYSP